MNRVTLFQYLKQQIQEQKKPTATVDEFIESATAILSENRVTSVDMQYSGTALNLSDGTQVLFPTRESQTDNTGSFSAAISGTKMTSKELLPQSGAYAITGDAEIPNTQPKDTSSKC